MSDKQHPKLLIPDFDRFVDPRALRRGTARVSWVRMPTHHDGLGFRTLMAYEGGVEAYGLWCCLVQIGANTRTRGELTSNGAVLGARSLALKLGMHPEIVRRALKTLVEVGWLQTSSGENTLWDANGTPMGALERGGEGREGGARGAHTPAPEIEPRTKPPTWPEFVAEFDRVCVPAGFAGVRRAPDGSPNLTRQRERAFRALWLDDGSREHWRGALAEAAKGLRDMLKREGDGVPRWARIDHLFRPANWERYLEDACNAADRTPEESQASPSRAFLADVRRVIPDFPQRLSDRLCASNLGLAVRLAREAQSGADLRRSIAENFEHDVEWFRSTLNGAPEENAQAELFTGK